MPAPRAGDVLVDTALQRDAELGVIRAPAQGSATPVRLAAPGMLRVPGCVEWRHGWRQPQRLARTQRVDRRPLVRLVTRRLRLPRANTTGDPDG
jgi:hypothetical protein